MILLINQLDEFDKNNSIEFDINGDQKISMDWLKFLIIASNKYLKSSSISTDETILPVSKSYEQFINNSSWQLNKTHLNIVIKKRYGDFLKKSVKDTIVILFKEWRNQDQLTKNQIIQLLLSMYELGWTSLYYRDYMNVFLQEINKHVHDICDGEFNKIQIPVLEQWIEIELLPFASQALLIDSEHIIDTKYQNLKDSLAQSLFQSYSRIRAKELFEIVADFPDSIIAIRELKEAATISGLLGHVGKVFRSIVRKRLLHSGASTSQILDIYVLMIRSLRVLDSSDLLLNFVAAPVRAYLMHRKDTVRSIVSSLTEGKDSELHGELRKGGSLEYGADEDDEEDGPGINWEPRKRDPDLMEVGARGLDVLALLVSIYGSTDLFVSEYRNLLADKILSNLEYDADNEVSTLELLKIRFGEESLHSCEVMLRDLEDSRRINNSVTFELLKTNSLSTINNINDNGKGIVDYIIVSDNYWPAFSGDDDKYIHHSRVAEYLTAFENSYTAIKKPRKIHPISHLGCVEVELSFDDGSIRTFSVLPIQATLIFHLEEKGSITLSQLALLIEMEEDDVHRYMIVWISKGVINEFKKHNSNLEKEEIIYSIIEEQSLNVLADLTKVDGDGDEDKLGLQLSAASEAQEKASFISIEVYIKGMLTGHDSMPIERIHTLMKLVSSGAAGDLKYDMNIIQLRRFLQAMVDSSKIECLDGVYKVCKNK